MKNLTIPDQIADGYRSDSVSKEKIQNILSFNDNKMIDSLRNIKIENCRCRLASLPFNLSLH